MDSRHSPTRVLFTGYAPVHFVCFQSLYNELLNTPGVEVKVSGGLRTRNATGYDYDPEGLYSPFGVDAENIVTVDEIADQDYDILFAANTKLIQPRSAKTRIQIFHGISFRNRAVRSKNMSCDYYFMVGPYMMDRFVSASLFEENDPRAVPIGFMKTDALINGTLNRVDFLKRYGLTGNRPVVLYAPTGLQHNSLETIGEEVIQRLHETGKYDVLIKLHDHPKDNTIDWAGRLSRFEGPHCHVVRELDVIQVLHSADVLLTDASSVSNEYSLMDRPMVFLDVPELIAASRRVKGSMIDVDRGRWGGLLATDPGSVDGAIDVQLKNPTMLSPVRQEIAGNLFYNPGRATESAIEWLKEHHLLPKQPITQNGSAAAARSQTRIVTPASPNPQRF